MCATGRREERSVVPHQHRLHLDRQHRQEPKQGPPPSFSDSTGGGHCDVGSVQNTAWPSVMAPPSSSPTLVAPVYTTTAPATKTGGGGGGGGGSHLAAAAAAAVVDEPTTYLFTDEYPFTTRQLDRQIEDLLVSTYQVRCVYLFVVPAVYCLLCFKTVCHVQVAVQRHFCVFSCIIHVQINVRFLIRMNMPNLDDSPS